MPFKPFFPGWVTRNKHVLARAKRQRFKNQREVDKWCNKQPEAKGRRGACFHAHDDSTGEQKYKASLLRDRRKVAKAKDKEAMRDIDGRFGGS